LIQTWLGDRPLDSFKADLFGREPFVLPDKARGAAWLLGWETVDRLVESPADRLAVRDGWPYNGPDPQRAADARALFEHGYSLVVRRCEEHDEGLCGLASAFERDFGGDVEVRAFATPAGHRSFGWRYHCEDLFVAQTLGVTEYRLRRNTLDPEPTIEAMPRDVPFEREKSPILACTLVAGDWLYIPRGFWHDALAVEDSLGIATGVLTASARGMRPPRRPAAERFRG
jgi:ribosomal protein L16 Arg81 hydroxylase